MCNRQFVFWKPKLLFNGRVGSVKLLLNSEIQVKTVSYIDDLPVTQKFKNVNFDDDEDYIVSFLVPPNIKTVKLSISSHVLDAENTHFLNH